MVVYKNVAWGIHNHLRLGSINRMAVHSAQDNSCADEVCPVPCSEHGTCVGGQCRCEQGWQGPNCRDPQCPGNCNGHGVCNLPSPTQPGECTCDYGWGGASCNRLALYQVTGRCPGECSGNGLCFNGECACLQGFMGHDCGIPTFCYQPCR